MWTVDLSQGWMRRMVFDKMRLHDDRRIHDERGTAQVVEAVRSAAPRYSSTLTLLVCNMLLVAFVAFRYQWSGKWKLAVDICSPTWSAVIHVICNTK